MRIFLIFLIFSLSSLNANSFENKLNAGIELSTFNNTSSTQLKVGYTSISSLNNEFIIGFGNNIYFGTSNKNSKLLTLDLNAIGGYTVYRDLSVFLIANYVIQKSDSDYYDGFGYGISLEQKLSYNLYLEALVKTANLKNNSLNDKYNSVGLAIKYVF